MDNSNKFTPGISILWHPHSIFIYILFGLFFVLYEIVNLGGKLFFSVHEKIYLISSQEIITALSLSLLPLVVVRLNQNFGHLRLLWWSFAVFLFPSLMIWLVDDSIYGFIFLFPILTRFFNNGLNPKIIQLGKQQNGRLGQLFGIRDFFLYTGSALGAFIGQLSHQFARPYLFLFRFGTGIIFLLFLLLSFTFYRQDQSLFMNKNSIQEASRVPKNPNVCSFKNLQHKQEFLFLLGISSLNTFIGITFAFLPSILTTIGINSARIFNAYGYGNILVAVLSIFAAFVIPKKQLKIVYLFDLGFDILPLSLLLWGYQNPVGLFLSILMLLGRDFIRPLSMEYIYSFFSTDETDYVWGRIHFRFI